MSGEPGAANYAYDSYTANTTFTFEQSVQGNGYFMTYKYAKMGNLEFKDYIHGSGSIDNENELLAQELYNASHPYDVDWEDFTQSCIQYREDNAMVYAPMTIAVGTGYYAAHPIDYSSLLKEKTWIKNRRSTSMMHHEIEYAHAIDKELDVTLKEKFRHKYDPEWEGIGYTQMRINEDVTDGKIHIGVLQGSNAPVALQDIPRLGEWQGTTAWKNPAIEIDEDYWGTYHIEKNMTLDVPYKRVQKIEDWLPCCFGGYETMDVHDVKGTGAKGIFDCSCYKVPTTAQFPRTYP